MPILRCEAPREATENVSTPNRIVADEAMAAAEPRFVAPALIDASGAAPRLAAGKCKSCGALSFPRSQVCPACLSDEIGETHLASEGVLYSFATVHQAPRNWIVPYHLGYVDLTDGIRVLAHIDGEPVIGGKVRLGIGRVGTAADGTPLSSYVFTPAGGSSA
jgi:uncharacterized OB-fold protein